MARGMLAALVLSAVVGHDVADGSAGGGTGGPSARPNILVILTDDQRPDTLGVMPATSSWFAAGGTTFADGTTPIPLCCPARATLFTGRYAHNHGVTTNRGSRLPQPTLQRRLSQAGYLTGLSGKYLNGSPLWRDPPAFDRWAVLLRGYTGARFNLDGRVQRVSGYSTDVVAARAMRFIRAFDQQEDRRPWFLVVAPHAPHQPFVPAPRHAAAAVPPWEPSPAAMEEDRSDKPPSVQASWTPPAEVQARRDGQLRTLLAVDQLVGRLMWTLARLGEGRRTLAFFLSDNGYLWGEHGLVDKRYPYPESVGIPFLMRWPGRVGAGAADRRPASLVDVAPTILHAAGVAPGGMHLDGRSLLTAWDRDHLYFEYFPDPPFPVPPWAAIRTATALYVEHYGADGVTVSFREYYDLRDDPWLLRNVLADGDPTTDPLPTVLADLSARLAHDRACAGTTGPGACP
jgi:arylsulfatase A-like enzyme